MSSISSLLPLRTRKPRGQGASRRGEILEAAKRLFLDEGFEHATMRRIAGEVGVSPTALYLHFADKEAILTAIAEDFFAELLDVLQESQIESLPPLRRLKVGLRAYVDFALARPAEYRLTFLSTVRPVSQGDNCEELPIADRSFGILENAVTELMAAGVLRPNNVVLVAEAIWVSLHGLTSVALNLPDRIDTPLAQLTDAVIDMAIGGFLAQTQDV